MRARFFLAHVAIVCCLSGSLGCGGPQRLPASRSPDTTARDTAVVHEHVVNSPELIVEKDSVEVWLRANQWFDFEVPFRLVNNGSFLLGLPGCHVPNGPVVETLQDSVWQRWGMEYDLCDSPPQYVDPGSTRVDTLRTAGCFRRQNCSPTWVGDSSVTLRLVYRVYPTSTRIGWSSELSRLHFVEITSKPFKAVLQYRPCGNSGAPIGILC
jgi:hypothetical protein